MELRCKKIVIKGNKDCSKGDRLMITNAEGTETVCGKKKNFVFQSSSSMVLEFTSDKRKSGPGAKGCVVKCSKAATATTAPAPATTAPPATTATPEPTTTPAPVPCIDCTTEDAKPCQFPFIWQNITFTSCTLLND